MERSYATDNARELERLRALVSKLSDQDLASMVNEYWTVAGVLGHIAFWDGRALFLAGKLQRDGAFTPSDTEPENVDWINDSTRPLIHAIPPRQAAEVALRIAEETDELVASLSPELVAKIDANSPLNPVRADHRGEHLDEIEAALAGRDATRRPTSSGLPPRAGAPELRGRRSPNRRGRSHRVEAAPRARTKLVMLG